MSRRVSAALATATVLAVLLAPQVSKACTAPGPDTDVCSLGCDHTTLLDAVNAAVGGETICIAAGAYDESATVVLDVDVTVERDSAGGLVQITGADPILHVNNGSDVTLRGLTLGPDTDRGLQVSGSSMATLDETTFTGLNTGDTWAGAFVEGGSTLDVSDSTFTNNTANSSDSRGGGIRSAGSLTVTDTHFEGNHAFTGGAIATEGTNGHFEGARLTVCDNTASWVGGGIRIVTNSLDSTSRMTASVFYNNAHQGLDGGGHIRAQDGLDLSFLTLVRGTAVQNGSAMFIDQSAAVDLTNSVIEANNTSAVHDQNSGFTNTWNYWNNTDDVNNTSIGPNSITSGASGLNPGGGCDFADLYPPLGSILIDAADPAFTDAFDGTRADLGAFGGPDAMTLPTDQDHDYYLSDDDDCDDTDPDVNPGGDDSQGCDGIDQDCDGTADDDVPGGCDQDNDGYTVGDGDCDDNDNSIFPGAFESCDGIDSDCSGGGVADNGEEDGDGDGFSTCEGDCDDNESDAFPGNSITVDDDIDNDCNGGDECYEDADQDGFGNIGFVDDIGGNLDCTDPGESVTGSDCDDADPNNFPGNPEVCDGQDNDCNGVADFDGGGQEVDADGDGYLRCQDDCRDTDAEIHPGRAEVCDGKDNDCSHGGVTTPDELDDDFDSYVECTNWVGGAGTDGGDCDDTDADRYPSNPEICDGKDSDCNTFVDDGLVFVDYYSDSDGDGYGDDQGAAQNLCLQPPGTSTDALDCDDSDANINPLAAEACDSVDNDCNGQIDDGITNVDYYADTDGDGFGGGTFTGNDCQPPNLTDVPNTTDCDDAAADINPGEIEQCDAVDHDCDGDFENGLTQLDFYLDTDGDGYGDMGDTPVPSCQAPTGRVGNALDCDDSFAGISPDALEVCDGLDNDCNGLADLDDGLPSQTYYTDPDSDGWGDSTDPGVASCAPIGGLVSLFGDCDELDPLVNPSALEICDGLDNDCNGLVDGDDGLPEFDYFDDVDGDGFGDEAGSAGLACEAPAGFADVSGDCDDSNSTIYPGAVEQCDGEDNDCNALIDDDVATTDWYVDADADGFGETNSTPTPDCLQPSGTVANALDCDDSVPDVNPDADEICDGLDNDCDGDVDDDDTDGNLVATLYYPDLDGDGFGDELVAGESWCAPPPGLVDNRLDCADGNANLNPQAVEACPDGIDNDCDGAVDADDPNYTDTPVVYWFDQDGDGYGTPALTADACSGEQPLGFVPPTNGLDCNDGEFVSNPGGTEACDGFDNDCNGTVDDGFPTLDYYPDLDDDTYGDAAAPGTAACAPDLVAVSQMVLDNTDCDDLDETVNPGEDEICDDGTDNDCVDGDLLTQDYWLDSDLDGYGTPGTPSTFCETPVGFASNPDDCDDSLASVNPGATEVCNDGIDDDCDPSTEESPATWYADDDGDDFGDPTEPLNACEQPPGYVANDDDCDPADGTLTDDCSGEFEGSTGCSCDAGSQIPVWLGVMVALIGVRRRRSAA